MNRALIKHRISAPPESLPVAEATARIRRVLRAVTRRPWSATTFFVSAEQRRTGLPWLRVRAPRSRSVQHPVIASRWVTREDNLRVLSALAEQTDGVFVGLVGPEDGLEVCSGLVLDWLAELERQAVA